MRNDEVNRELGALDLVKKLEDRLKRSDQREEQQLSTLVSLHRRHLLPEMIITHTDDLVEDELVTIFVFYLKIISHNS